MAAPRHFARFHFSTAEKASQEEVKFTYKNKTHYHILQVDPKASDKQLKIAYLKLAKLYHPDVYSGVNKDHFKRVTEAYNVLKNPAKRQEYDNQQKIRRHSASKASAEEEFGPQKGKKVREEQDPEFERAFQKMNTSRLFD